MKSGPRQLNEKRANRGSDGSPGPYVPLGEPPQPADAVGIVISSKAVWGQRAGLLDNRAVLASCPPRLTRSQLIKNHQRRSGVAGPKEDRRLVPMP
jgi:hypothetical protein